MMIQYLSHGQGPIEGRTPDPYRRVGYVSRFIYSFQSHLSCEMQTRNKWRQQQQQQQQQKSPKQNTIAIRQSWKKTNKGNDETRIEKKKNKYKIQTKVTSENGRLGPFSRTYTGVMHRHSSRYVPNIFSSKIFQTDSLNQDQRQQENRQKKNKQTKQ